MSNTATQENEKDFTIFQLLLHEFEVVGDAVRIVGEGGTFDVGEGGTVHIRTARLQLIIAQHALTITPMTKRKIIH